MNNILRWPQLAYRKKLKKIHAWNAWIVLLLAVTGLVLYIPILRGPLAPIRVPLKNIHIILGIVSIIILLLYLPLIGKHVKTLTGKRNQQFNLGVVLFLLCGWSLTGIMLWQFRHVPDRWTQWALYWHDMLTWVGIPWAIFHSISRSRWLKKQPSKSLMNHQESFNQQWFKHPPVSRRTFIRLVTGLLLVIGLGPPFYKWMKGIMDTGGSKISDVMKEDANRMIPDPAPLPKSDPPIGGGSQGNFRIYTVTEIPSFSSDTWAFAIGGMVQNPTSLSWEDFLSLPRKVQVSDFHCVTGWSVYSVTWEGILVSQLLDMAGVDPKAKYVKFYSGDGVYTDTLTVEQAHRKNVIVPVLMDGKPLPQKLGGPIRLIVPDMYAYKSVKWLQAIECIEEEHIGYWQQRGYEIDAWLPDEKL